VEITPLMSFRHLRVINFALKIKFSNPEEKNKVDNLPCQIHAGDKSLAPTGDPHCMKP
jgi:hypothetical protein